MLGKHSTSPFCWILFWNRVLLLLLLVTNNILALNLQCSTSAWDRDSRSLSVIIPPSVCLALSVVVELLPGSCTGPALPLSFIPDPGHTHYSIMWHFIILDMTLVVIFVIFLCLNLCALPLLSFNGFTICLADGNFLCRLGWPWVQWPACSCLLNVGVKGVCHCALVALKSFFCFAATTLLYYGCEYLS